jgi:type IV pilus assembly protein PilP
MAVAAGARNLVFGLALMMLASAGCGNRSESEPSPQPAVVYRKKIGVPEKEAHEAVKPKSDAVLQDVSEVGGTTGPKPEEPEAEPPLPGKEPMAHPAETSPRSFSGFYDPTGKPDPFEPLFAPEVEFERVTPAREKTRKKRPPLTPLQRIDLSQLKLAGIIVSPVGNKALIEEPSGKGYIISRGTYVGTNFGRIKRILGDRIIVEEEVEDILSGKTKLKTTELRLQQKAEDL